MRFSARTRMLAIAAAVLLLVAALATYGFAQRNDARRLAGELGDTAEARRLASASTLIAEDDPELAMLLALQSLDASAAAGLPALVEAEEALHWSLQAAGVAYGHPDAPVEVRVGPNGPTGIPRLPIPDLLGLARGRLGGRALSSSECSRYGIDPCPSVITGSEWPRLPSEPIRPELKAQDDKPLTGTRITITGAMEPDAVRRDLDVFQQLTGIEVEYRQPTSDLGSGARSAGVPIDLAVFPTAGNVQDAAAAGELIDVASYIDVETSRVAFGHYAVDAAMIGDQYFAVPIYGGMKGIVWYPLRQFAEAGYTAPKTWGELVSLSNQMVADGNTPWCMGFESEAFSGWPGTDWIEALVMRVGGLDVYDRWMAGAIPFGDPIVREAFSRFGEIAFGDGFVRYGTDAISRTSDFDAMDHLTTEPPGCWMDSTGSWMPNNVRAATGGEVGFFPLPPLEAGGDTPVIGSAAMIGAFRDRPEIREFVRWLHNPEWGALWASDPDRNFLSPNLQFDPGHCRVEGFSEDVNAMRVALCELQRSSLSAGLQRFDASDEMPPQVGGVLDGQPRGRFLQAMLDYVDAGPANLDELLASIDAAWPHSAG